MKIYIFQNKKNGENVVYLQISLRSGLMEDSQILLSASAFNL
jgi:hypothetical protein